MYQDQQGNEILYFNITAFSMVERDFYGRANMLLHGSTEGSVMSQVWSQHRPDLP